MKLEVHFKAGTAKEFEFDHWVISESGRLTIRRDLAGGVCAKVVISAGEWTYIVEHVK